MDDLLSTLGALVEQLVEDDTHMRDLRTNVKTLSHVLLLEWAALHNKLARKLPSELTCQLAGKLASRFAKLLHLLFLRVDEALVLAVFKVLGVSKWLRAWFGFALSGFRSLSVVGLDAHVRHLGVHAWGLASA